MGSNNSKSPNGQNSTAIVPSNEVIVHTKYGKIAGKQMRFDGIDGTANAFLGIPFARPPVGQLRFKKPQSPEPWTGVRPAKKFPPQCPQNFSPIISKIFGIASSEDCLYLNVFGPAIEEREEKWLFPVIVFIHGGGFVNGNSQSYGDAGICRHLVLEQKCVFVTIQYRLGPMGFFSTGDGVCEDNIGLWDMTMALEWVQENVGEFGGDKGNVTVMGQSAGGVAADLLALSPHSRNLFHKLIPMGGNSNCTWNLADNAVDRCREMCQELGIYTTNSDELIEKLRKVPAQKLTMGLGDGRYPFGFFKCPLAPRIDGKFFPKSLEELRKEAPKKPRLIGQCQMEGLFFMLNQHNRFTLSKVQEIIARQFPESGKFHELRGEALKMYLRDEMEKTSKDRDAQVKAVAEILSDLFVGIANLEHVNGQIAVGNGDRTFLYTFDYCNPRLITLLGLIFKGKCPMKISTHACELFYIFKNADFNLFGRKLMNENDEKLVGIVTKMWANFAKYGDPNGVGKGGESLGFRWEPVGNGNEGHPSRHLSIKLEPEMKETFQAGRPKQWIKLLAASSEKA